MNPYWAAYLAHEPRPTAWGFMAWISERWREFERLHGMKPHTGIWRQAEFGPWLANLTAARSGK